MHGTSNIKLSYKCFKKNPFLLFSGQKGCSTRRWGQQFSLNLTLFAIRPGHLIYPTQFDKNMTDCTPRTAFNDLPLLSFPVHEQVGWFLLTESVPSFPIQQFVFLVRKSVFLNEVSRPYKAECWQPVGSYVAAARLNSAGTYTKCCIMRKDSYGAGKWKSRRKWRVCVRVSACVCVCVCVWQRLGAALDHLLLIVVEPTQCRCSRK